MLLRFLVVSLLSTLLPFSAYAWGSAGHSIIAELAERRLTPSTLAAVKQLLGGQKSLASISSWADQIQVTRPETRNWHFVNIPFEAAVYVEERDCRPTPAGDCVVKAIGRAQATLRDKSRPTHERSQALMLLVHFIGDVHQPLHCANRNDAGGSQFPVRFFGQASNLHLVWDVLLIERRTFYWGEYVRMLESRIRQLTDPAAAVASSPQDWANDAHRLAVTVAYAVPADGELGESYFQTALPLVERQMVSAALRLSAVLEQALGRPSRKRPLHRSSRARRRK